MPLEISTLETWLWDAACAIRAPVEAASRIRAARLVGPPSYQTFTNWLKRYGVIS